jgi:hypothetical protein
MPQNHPLGRGKINVLGIRDSAGNCHESTKTSSSQRANGFRDFKSKMTQQKIGNKSVAQDEPADFAKHIGCSPLN